MFALISQNRIPGETLYYSLCGGLSILSHGNQFYDVEMPMERQTMFVPEVAVRVWRI